MVQLIKQNPIATFDQSSQWEYGLAKSTSTGLTTSFGANGISCAADQVALIDRIEINCLTDGWNTTVATLMNSGTQTTCVVAGTIPPWTPAAGNIIVTRSSGTRSVLPYTSWTGSTFTITSAVFNGTGATASAPVGSTVKAQYDSIKAIAEVNGKEIYFDFPGNMSSRSSQSIVWEPKGAMVVQPSQVMKWKASKSGSISVTVTYRKMQLTKAASLGYLTPSMPTVASTNSVAGSGFTGGTQKAIVAATAGSYVEILGFTATGHNFSASQDSMLLAFWDGNGTFSSACKKIFRAQCCGIDTKFAPKVIVNNTDGCIRGPVGYGVYVLPSSNITGATPPADINIIYRLVKAPQQTDSYTLATALTTTETAVVVNRAIPLSTAPTGTLFITSTAGTVVSVAYTAYSGSTFTVNQDFTSTPVAVGQKVAVQFYYTPVNEPAGTVSQTPNRLGKWWAYTEADVPTYAANTVTAIFSGLPSSMVKITGHAMSLIADVATVAPNTTSMWIGADISTGFALGPLLALEDDGLGAECSRHMVSEQLLISSAAQAPAFYASEIVANEVPARSQLAWGTIGSRARSGTEFSSSF